VDVAEVETAGQKMATIALGGGDVDGAAFRAVDEVAATEMARAVVVDMRQKRARRLR